MTSRMGHFGQNVGGGIRSCWCENVAGTTTMKPWQDRVGAWQGRIIAFRLLCGPVDDASGCGEMGHEAGGNLQPL